MVYSNHFVSCVLVNGTPQKELANGVVPIAFGQEYSLRFRNKNKRRAVVKFTIDGENVSGGGYVIGAHSSIDIHRHHDKDARFKFVSLESSEAVDYGKNGPNFDGTKGVIEAKFYLEKEPPKQEYHHYHPYPVPVPQPPPYPWHPYWNTGGNWTYCSNSGQTRGSSCGGSINITGGTGGCSSAGTSAGAGGEINITSGVGGSAGPGIPSVINCTAPNVFNVPPITFPCIQPTLQEGCTVEGGMSGQSFYTTSLDYENDYVTVRLVLKGITPGQVPGIIAEQAEYCTGCGAKRHKANDRFCASCGKKL